MKNNKYLVFLVDDDVIFLEMLRESLSSDKRLEIILFESAELCILNIEMQPDIIFLDYDFHKADINAMSGLDALKKIKEKLPKVKVIMLTAQEDPNMVLTFIRNGADNYIVKDEEAFENSKNIIDEVISEIEDKEDTKNK